jgi:hypothetical protein
MATNATRQKWQTAGGNLMKNDARRGEKKRGSRRLPRFWSTANAHAFADTIALLRCGLGAGAGVSATALRTARASLWYCFALATAGAARSNAGAASTRSLCRFVHDGSPIRLSSKCELNLQRARGSALNETAIVNRPIRPSETAESRSCGGWCASDERSPRNPLHVRPSTRTHRSFGAPTR